MIEEIACFGSLSICRSSNGQLSFTASTQFLDNLLTKLTLPDDVFAFLIFQMKIGKIHFALLSHRNFHSFKFLFPMESQHAKDSLASGHLTGLSALRNFCFLLFCIFSFHISKFSFLYGRKAFRETLLKIGSSDFLSETFRIFFLIHTVRIF